MANIDQPMFPLLELPKKALKNVCRVMDPLQQLALSTCHEVTKKLVKSSGLKCLQFDVFPVFIFIKFSDQLIAALWFNPHDDHPGITCINANYNGGGRDLGDGMTYHWKLPMFTVRDWIEHLLSVLNRTNMNFLNCQHGTLEFFQQSFVGFNVDRLNIENIPAEDINLLIKGFPRLEYLQLGSEMPEVDFQKVLMQNLSSVNPAREQKLVLNDLLLCNSAHFESFNDALTANDMNRFVKLWMKGSNPKINYIRVRFMSRDQILNKEMVLRGIKYEDQTEDRTFIHVTYLTREIVLRGGCEIKRNDGTMAIVVVYRYGFEMCIWT